MKKFLTVFLALLLVFSVSGCKNNDNLTTTNVNSLDAPQSYASAKSQNNSSINAGTASGSNSSYNSTSSSNTNTTGKENLSSSAYSASSGSAQKSSSNLNSSGLKNSGNNLSQSSKPSYTCSLTIECTSVLNNLNKLKKEKAGLIKNGIIFKTSTVTFYQNETAFDLLKRVCKENNILLEFSVTPIINSAYIEGINNLYEFDCGSGSGWKYIVNNKVLGVGCSQYYLKPNDNIVWHYSCSIDEDLTNLTF